MKNKNIFLKRVIKPEEFLNKRFKPSIQSKSNFIKLFNLVYPKFSEFIDVKSIEWNKNSFQIMLLDKSCWEIIHLSLKDNFWSKKCWGVLCTDKLCTWVHYEVQNDAFLKFLVYILVKWKDLDLNNFLRILCTDIKAKKEYYQIFWKANRPPFSIIQDWGHPLHEFRFIVPEWVFRNTDQSISLSLPEASIHHSERECQWISPNNKDKWYHFFNFPNWFYEHNFDKYYYLTTEEKEKYISWDNMWHWMGLSTDLNELDIVMWEWTDKLKRAIDHVVENADKNNIKMISFNCCCVPRIVWDDIYSVLEKAKKKTSIPFVFQGQLEKTPYEQKIWLLEDYIKNIDSEKIKVEPNSISIFWYHENEYQKNIWDILNENNIKINTSFIPTIDVRILPLMYKSELFIFSPNNFQKEAFEYPFQAIWKKSISPKYPYWVKNTNNWLQSVLWEFNIDYKKSKISESIIREYQENIEIVKNKNYKIGISFIWKQEVKNFFSTDYMNNIDVIECLEEMWFGIELFVYDDFKKYNTNNDDNYKVSDWNHEDIIKIVNDKIVQKSKANLHFYSTKEEFDKSLDDSEINIMYSDIFFDDRITKRGINQFNIRNFYVWYNWALKSLNSLMQLCETSYYKNYSKYFIN